MYSFIQKKIKLLNTQQLLYSARVDNYFMLNLESYWR